MLTISCAEMQAMDQYAIEKVGIPSIVLMESAALKVIENIDLEKMNSFTVVCATGNNGGDGLAIARRLLLANKKVDLFIIGKTDHGTKDFQVNLNILRNMNQLMTSMQDEQSDESLKKSLQKNDLTIDAIFGIGLDREISGKFYQIIQSMNQHSKEILAVDLPSGLDGDNGRVLGIAVQANRTISFHKVKKGLPKNKTYSGEIIVADIGIPEFVTDSILIQSR